MLRKMLANWPRVNADVRLLMPVSIRAFSVEPEGIIPEYLTPKK